MNKNKKMKSTCKYAKKYREGYCKCDRDNSVRRDPCHCCNYKKKWTCKFF